MNSPTGARPLVLLAMVLAAGYEFAAGALGQPGPPGNRNDGPWNHRVLLATSKDGRAWTVGDDILAAQASVPELFLGPEGRPILLFVDASGRARAGALGALARRQDGSWERRDTNLRGADPNVIMLPDKTYRAYTKEPDGTIIVLSSRDGLAWREWGEAFHDERYSNATDPDVFQTPDGWVMLLSLGPRLLRCTSSDGLKFLAGETFEVGGSVSDTVAVAGGWRTYFHVNPDPRTGSKMRIRSAFTRDGRTWQSEDGDRVVAPSTGAASLGVADPAPVQLREGSWLMAVKSFIGRGEGGFVAPVSAGREPVDPRRFAVRDAGPPEGGNPNVRGPLPQRGQPEPGLTSHQVCSASSRDGLTWTRDEGVRIPSASVPCAVNDGDQRVLIYFVQPPNQPGQPETVACAVSTDGMTFKQDHAFRIEGLSTLKAVDPSILKDRNGKFRLYYLASDHRGDPAAAPGPHAIHLALSDDGLRFREQGAVFRREDLVDPDVFQFKNQWFMYVFAGHATIIATSTDGGKFTYARDLSPPDWGTTAPVPLPDGRLRLYAFEQRVPSDNAVGSFLSTDGLNWTAERGERLRAPAGEQITDPFVVPWHGGYKMYFKSSLARRGGFGVPASAGRNPGHPQRAGRDDVQPPEGGTPHLRPPRAPNNFNPQPPPQNLNADGPWNQDVIAYRVSRAGTIEKVATFERAGVPTLARLQDGRLIVAHQHFPENEPGHFDKVAVHFSNDDGKSWTAPQVIEVAGLPEGMRFPFDPTLVPLPEGRVRLYFTGNMGRTFSPSTPAIHSALSSDGVNYTYEPGARFAVEGRIVIDCAVALHDGVFHLIAPDNGTPAEMEAGRQRREPPRGGSGYHAVSQDGLNFERVADVTLPGQNRWLGNMQSDGGRLAFFGTGPGPWPVTSADGKSWSTVGGTTRLPGADPGAVKLKDGSWLVAVTGPPREGTASARNRPPPGRDGFAPPGQSDGPRGPGPKSTAEALSQMWSQGRATGSGPVRLQNLSLRLGDIETLIPMGLTASGHVTPSDHLYIVPKSSPGAARRTDVLAVADGFLVVVQWRPKGSPDPTVFDREVDLRLTLEHSGTCWSYYDHVTELEASLRKEVGAELRPGPPFNVRIPVKAGQVIGHVQRLFDFALVDTAVTRTGFVRPEQFLHRDPWKPHTVDPFDYLEEPLRGMLLLFNPRQAPPFGGKIDFDIDGKLVGNWYAAGTGGYAGLNRRLDYWDGHVAFVYHHIEPTNIVVSLGNYAGQPRQFWVKGNAPDPANVSAADGVVRYELISGRLGSSGQRTVRYDADAVQGTVLAQVLPERRLKLEVFPDRTAAEVQGFTSAAKTYER